MQLFLPKQAGCRQAGQAGKVGNEWDAFLTRKMHGRQGNRSMESCEGREGHHEGYECYSTRRRWAVRWGRIHYGEECDGSA